MKNTTLKGCTLKRKHSSEVGCTSYPVMKYGKENEFCFEIPDSFNGGGVSPSRLGSSPLQPEKTVCVDCAIGPPRPVPQFDESIPGVLGSSSNCDVVEGALPLPRSCSPCQDLVLPPNGRPGVHIESANLPASLTGNMGPSYVIDHQGNTLPPNGDVLDRPCSLLGALVTSNCSTASASPMGAVDHPPGKLWSSVVKQNSPGCGVRVCWSEAGPEGMLGCDLDSFVASAVWFCLDDWGGDSAGKGFSVTCADLLHRSYWFSSMVLKEVAAGMSESLKQMQGPGLCFVYYLEQAADAK
ncbi:hypothetical protein Nepgr_013446 [Nepenthes gracilis]|uniref:Uncharacterized protein n=1 Tax=Nepenthes gracilis TaxID=150966 RepID=A0AAD3SIU1_NEPGR|nr:hypothetical protein Nepgr_013446 [Nepenthes gracilis]